MEVKKLGPNRFEYRVPGAKEWSSIPSMAGLKCPKCGLQNAKFETVGSTDEGAAGGRN